ncbi:hypothetical protein, partial [Pedobacter nutrimenti]|uniref:hypothetical protein n=1 Tax=Pedobacter nutrimenti TaxID=1241337 RepID=UPI001B883EED
RYLATLVNDISLMNLSAGPHGSLYIFWFPSPKQVWSFMFQIPLLKFNPFNLFYSVYKLRL